MTEKQMTETVTLAYSMMTPKGQVFTPVTPIVMLHGCFGCRENLRTVAEWIADLTRRTVKIMDLRNHGDSPRSDYMCFDSMTSDLDHLIETVLGLKKVVLLGHSIGGKVCMLLALRKPDLVEKLLSVDMFPGPIPERLMPDFKRFMSTISNIQFKGHSLSEVKSNASKDLEIAMPDPDERDLKMQSIVQSDDTESGFRWKFDIGNLKKNFESINSFADVTGLTYYGPTKVIVGEKSDFVREEHNADYKRLFPNYSLIKIPDAGHWVHRDNPEAFVKITFEFLAQ